jgi:two-component system nitrate/nitrite response regulator NarL
MHQTKKQYVMKTANVEAQLRCPTPASATLLSMSSGAEPGRFPQAGRSGARKPIRVLLVDDHPIVRKGLSSCLSRQENIQVVGEAGDGREALRKAKELAPDVVMMDIDMPHMNGLTATELMRKEMPGVKVLVLSMHTHSDVVMRILQSGARGYIVKEASSEELLRAVETVHAGESFFSSDVARLALNQFVRGGGEGPQPGQISNREREVLIAIAEGLSNKEIASRLSVGVRTVETHRERIMRKLNIHSVAGLTRFAIQKGLVPLQKEPEH